MSGGHGSHAIVGTQGRRFRRPGAPINPAGHPMTPAQTLIQPAITGDRQLTQAEADGMNKIKALGVQLGSLVAELRSIPATPAAGGPVANGWYGSHHRSALGQYWRHRPADSGPLREIVANRESPASLSVTV